MMKALASTLACTIVIGAVGCGAGGPPPNDQLAAAQAEVGRAQAGGAPMVPEAKLHLQLAIEDLEQSKKLIGSDNAQATVLVEVAKSEAQLAFALAKENDAHHQVDHAQVEATKQP